MTSRPQFSIQGNRPLTGQHVMSFLVIYKVPAFPLGCVGVCDAERSFYFVMFCKHRGGSSGVRAFGKVKSGSDKVWEVPGPSFWSCALGALGFAGSRCPDLSSANRLQPGHWEISSGS